MVEWPFTPGASYVDKSLLWKLNIYQANSAMLHGYIANGWPLIIMHLP
jgi:hypothetical protein